MKVVFIDGESLSGMQYILEMKIRFGGLFDYLKNIGDTREIKRALYVKKILPYLTDDERRKQLSFQKPLKAAGFELIVIKALPGEEKDDDFINEEIKKAALDEDISEIILVSADLLDYLPCLQEATSKGKKVFIIATLHPKQDGKLMVCESFTRLCEENGITFIELADLRDEIVLRAGVGKDTIGTEKNDNTKNVSSASPIVRRVVVTFPNIPQEMLVEIVNRIIKIIAALGLKAGMKFD